jgi:DNA-binding IclR family transcriptional regulator
MKISSIEKSLRVIDLLSKSPRGSNLLEMSGILRIPPSTIHHILQTFAPYDYVAQDPETKKYSLGFRFLEIGKRIIDNIDIRKIASKYLFKLHEKCRETVHLAILRNGRVIYIDKVDTPGGLSLATYIGFSTDPHAAAGGKVLLSELPPKEIKNIYRGRSLKKYGKRTITSVSQLMDELERVRKQGYAIDDEEYYEGVRCVAAPIKSGGKIVAAISITGSIFAITMDRIDNELKDLVMKQAEKISSEMKW